jgi:DNA-binding response OmpR family regulator
MLRIILEQEGYCVRTAANGAEALSACETSRPDLVILDLLLPVLDGPAFLSLLDHCSLPCVPVVVCSAEPARTAGYRGTRVQDVLGKPFDLNDLLALVRRNLQAVRPR